MLEIPNICYILKSWGFKDVKYDIPMPIELVPTTQCKKSSLRRHFRRNSWKLGSQKVHVHCACSFFMQFFFLPFFTSPGGIFGQKCETSSTQKMTENGRIWKNGKKCTVENCGTTYLDPKSKNNCSLFSSTFHVDRPVSRYGRLKLKFLCERISHLWTAPYIFCSLELTKTRNT